MNESMLGHGATDVPKDFLKVEAPKHSEIAGAFPSAVWIEKDQTNGFVTYPKRNQGSTNQCTCYAMAKALSIDEQVENGLWRELSPRSLYPYVFIAPEGGANSLNVANVACKQGMTLEHLYPTEGLLEGEVRTAQGYTKDAKQVAYIYAPGKIIEASADFETIAGIIDGYRQQGIKKGVMITIYGENNGTWLSAFPKPPVAKNGKLWGHRVIVTDFGLINGKKYLSIDNSAGEGIGNKGQQYLGEEYQPFIFGAIYTLNQPDDWQNSAISQVVKPKYQWNTNLTVGSSGPDVLNLQLALQSIGMFPVATFVKPTGSFFGITKEGVKLFQISFGLPVTGIVDLITRTNLNMIFK